MYRSEQIWSEEVQNDSLGVIGRATAPQTRHAISHRCGHSPARLYEVLFACSFFVDVAHTVAGAQRADGDFILSQSAGRPFTPSAIRVPRDAESAFRTPGIPVADEKRASESRGILGSGEYGPARAACISWHVAIPAVLASASYLASGGCTQAPVPTTTTLYSALSSPAAQACKDIRSLYFRILARAFVFMSDGRLSGCCGCSSSESRQLITRLHPIINNVERTNAALFAVSHLPLQDRAPTSPRPH